MSLHVTKTGVIQGYGARFSNLDSHKDVIEPGAFTETIANAKRTGRMPHMLVGHGRTSDLPIGLWRTMDQDSKGLFLEGELALGNSVADDLYALCRMSPPALSGLSIGWICQKWEVPRGGLIKRRVLAAHVVEVSLVSDPSNSLARLTAVKNHVGDDDLRALLRLAEVMRGYG